MQLPLTVLCHPRCSTCKKALSWLDEHHISYRWRSIIDDNPTKDELTRWVEQSRLSIRKFFNTSGNAYRALNVKAQLDHWEHDSSDGGATQAIELLSTDGMLCKRPLVIDARGNFVAVGFKQSEWEEELCQ